jgi:hypothetical protein
MRTTTLLAPMLCLVAALAGCATPYTKPEYLGTGFDARAVTAVGVAPVLDLRVDKSESLELDAWVHAAAKQFMTKRGYKVTTFGDRALLDPLQPAAGAETVEARVKDFTIPNGPRHLLVFSLVDAYSKLTFGSTGNAEMVGYLVDQQAREVVLRNKVVGQMGQGGLLGMAMRGMMTRAAIENATMKLVYSIPPRE